MKKTEIAVILGFILTLIIGVTTAFAKDCDNIRENVLRIHILANSDTKQDQQLKLKVRDRVLEETKDLFYNVNSKEKAQELAEKNIELIQKVAQDEIYENGYDYKVNAKVVNMFFDTRYYGEITMPAGWFDAVRLTIGTGKGHNWWCVMFPQMCIPCATKTQTFTDEEKDVLTKPKYKAEFAVVEIFEKIKSKITNSKVDTTVNSGYNCLRYVK